MTVVATSFALVASLIVSAPAAAVDAGVTGAVASSVADTQAVSADVVKAAAVVGFNAENIISDALFYDGGAMTAAEIQSFLNAKIGACTNGKCLNILTAGISSRAAVYSQTTGNLICSAIQGGSMKVAELIYRVQVACGISAKVILVTLQKEQGLTTSRAPSDWNLSAAMGASCPDTAPCDPAFAGVGPQILKGTQQLKTYKAANFGKQPGLNYIGYSPTASCGGTTLNIRNYATAALYSYTPYQPNAAALAAGYGLGNSCSSYGNRNFYNYYTSWFGSPLGQSDPVGAITSWDLTEQGVHVRGWALDPDSSQVITLRVKSGDLMLTRATANMPGVPAPGYPGYGTQRGFDVTVPLAPGTQTVCVVANNLGGGSNRTLECREVTPSGGSPYGAITQWKQTPTGVTVSGWIIDPDTTGSVDLRLKSDDNMLVRATANHEVRALATSHVAYGTAHGFEVDVVLGPATQSVCVAANNIGVGANRTIGCRDLSAGGGDPFGLVEGFTPTVGGVRVYGWVIDPDTADPISVRVKAGVESTRVPADRGRADIAEAYPGYGDAHGFDVVVPLPAGTSEVCVASNNILNGTNRTLGCASVTVLSGDPFGAVVWTPTVTGVRAVGWVIDPDTADSVSVRVKVGETQVSRVSADEERSDLASRYPAYGTRHGFSTDVSVGVGTHTVCIAANNVGAGANRTLGCTVATVRSGDPTGAIESWSTTPTGVRVSGWVIDPDTADPTSVRIKVGDEQVLRVTAGEDRSALATAYPAYGIAHGFSAEISLPAGTHTVCVASNNVGPGVNRTLGCTTVSIRGGDPFGAVPEWKSVPGGVSVSGWVIDPDTTDPISVRIKVGDDAATRLTADIPREDVGLQYPHYGAAHGFSAFIPLPSGSQALCVAANNVGVGQNRTLGCTSVFVSP